LSLGAEEVFTDDDQFSVVEGSSMHLYLSRWADVIAVVPATADFIAKASTGISDSLLLTILLASKKPILIAPSMNENMFLHPATQRNIETLKSYGYKIIEPDEGFLADLAKGKGRLKEPEYILEEILVELSPKIKWLKSSCYLWSNKGIYRPCKIYHEWLIGQNGYCFC
jgi:Phosphopantothenoylcysteine synthetase/decarboxylase